MICGATKKTIFKTHKAAMLRGDEILMDSCKIRKNSPSSYRAYKCEFCGFYHLSGKHSIPHKYIV